MKIATILTYYRPYTSGLTIYCERLSKELANSGHEVSVLCMQHDSKLPVQEELDRVKVMRAPVLCKIGKGSISYKFYWQALKLIASSDIVQLHLPQLESGPVSLLAFLLRKKVVLTYHCDLILPRGLINRVANAAVLVSNFIAGLLATKIVGYTDDYANHSHFLKRFRAKVEIIPPPVVLPNSAENEIQQLQNLVHPVIGMATRLATEKGVEVLIKALPEIFAKSSKGTVLFAGQHEGVLGEAEYYARILPQLEPYLTSGQWRFLGILNPAQMREFYRALDILVVPSLNATESFGLVQVEAMLNSVPVVAADLPGVRQPVKLTGMGEIARIGDSKDLAEKVLCVLRAPEHYRKKPAFLETMFSPSSVCKTYQELFGKIA